jgi:hypothetical protein
MVVQTGGTLRALIGSSLLCTLFRALGCYHSAMMYILRKPHMHATRTSVGPSGGVGPQAVPYDPPPHVPYRRYIGNGDPVIELERAHVLFGAQTPVVNGDVLK